MATLKAQSEAEFIYQTVFYIDRRLRDALQWRRRNAYPKKSQSDFFRDAIIEKLAREFPEAFQQNIAAE